MNNKNAPQAKGVRTFIQVIVGFVVGLAITVWAVPGVPDAIKQYVIHNAGGLLLSLGITTSVASGLVSFAQNHLEDK